MPIVSLTDLTVQRLKPGLYFDQKTPGFGLRVGKNRKTWLVIKGKARSKIMLGHYPALSLHDARKRAFVALGSFDEAKSTLAFAEALDLFLAQPRWRPNSKRVMVSYLKHFTWKRPLSKVTHEDVAAALDAIEAPSARAHALKDVRAFFNWCVPRYLPSSPCIGIKMEPQPTRSRVLDPDELRAVWIAADGMGYPYGSIVKLLILTGQRKSEIGLLRWGYVHDDHVVLPKETVKNNREHRFPLSALARNQLPEKADGHIFLGSQGDRPYNGYNSHHRELLKISETRDWTLHDLRRTFATNLAALGVPIHVAEKLLNHVSGALSGVAGIYNRHSYWDEQVAAVNAWEKRLLSLVAR